MPLHETFAALGDQTRFSIVERLLNEGELAAGEINRGLGISPPAVSRHLRILRESGLLEQRIDAQRRLYSVREEAVATIQGWVDRSLQSNLAPTDLTGEARPLT